MCEGGDILLQNLMCLQATQFQILFNINWKCLDVASDRNCHSQCLALLVSVYMLVWVCTHTHTCVCVLFNDTETVEIIWHS